MNRVVHFEIHAGDIRIVEKFYQDVFGWDIKDMGPEMGNYRTVTTGVDLPGSTWPGINGGITPRSGDNLPLEGDAVNAFVCIIEVDNIELYLEKVGSAGGSISLDTMEVPKLGKLAYCKDIEGNLFGMLQPL